MKKLILLAVLTAITVLTAACNSSNARIDDEQFNLTREEFLEDFDYLIYTLETNFPYLGIIYRRNGVDMLELAQELRIQIASEDFEINHIAFWNLLQEELFYYAWPIGHLRLFGYLDYSFHPDLTGVLRWHGLETDTEIFRLFGNRLVSHPQAWDIVSHSLLTEIIEENRIAYLRVPPFMMLSEHEQTINDFYSQLDGFEHLILDLRGNWGGWPSEFDTYIASPLIDGHVQTSFHHFLMAGQYSYDFFDRMLAGDNRIHGFDIEYLQELLPYAQFSPEVMADLELMDYYFVETISIFPSGRNRAPFNGKIWMLVDDNILSGAMQVAAFYKDIGFATFVGEAGGGMPASRISSSFFRLPNTTFIVTFDPNYFLDNTGRPLEYGFVPHYLNREGMDALDTVLVLIGEGGY